MKRLVWGVIFATALFGQSADTGILGSVTDQSGSLIVGATVTISSAASGINKSVVTGADGQYEVRFLVPGDYVVEVRMSGFHPERNSGLELRIGQLPRVDFKLKVGAVNEEVQVSAQGVLLDTQSATMAATVTQERIVDLPLNGRNYVSLGNLTPGVVSSGTSFAANGARTFYEQISYDGTNVIQQRSNNGAPSPIIDAITEFKIQTGNYSAEYGGNAGANVQVQLKSGTNEFHGAAWDFLRNNDLDARGFFRPAPQPKNILRQNQFGGVVSGPIRRDKTFFMAAYEGVQANAETPASALVLTSAQLSGNFSGYKTITDPLSGIPFPGNIIPSSRLNLVAISIAQTYMPQPNVASTVANLSGVSTGLTHQHQALTRIDEYFSPKDQVFGHYIFYNLNNPSIGLAPVFETLNSSRNQSIAAQWLHTFSPTKINSILFGYDRAYALIPNPRTGTSFDAGKTLGINGLLIGGPGGTALTSVAAGLPTLSISGYLSMGDSTGGAALDGSRTQQLLDVFTMMKGSHTLKMGFDERKLADNANTTNQPFGAMNFTGNLSGNAAADYVLGYPLNATTPQGIPVSGVRQWRYGFFFNDDWKVNNRLTVNLGVRYDLLPVPYDALGTSRTLRFDLNPMGVLWPNPGTTTALWLNDYNHLAPRVGVAYRVTERTVFRTGYGIFTVTPNFDQINTLQNNPPIGANITAINPTVNPIATIQNPFPAALTGGATPIYNYVSVEPNRHHYNPYYQNWNAQAGHEFTRSDSLEVRYVGGKGTHLDSSMLNWNSPLPGPGAIQPRRLYPNLGEIRMWTSDGNSEYNALQAQYEHRFSRGLSATVAYTWSHLIDDQGSNLNGSRAQQQEARCDLCNNRADSSNDIRHRLVAGWTYRIPFTSQFKGIAGAVLSGWDIGGILTLQSGSPMFITENGDPQNVDAATGSYAESRPSLVAGQKVTIPNQTPNLWFNTAAFSTSVLMYGNSPRNPLAGPGLRTLDVSLSKAFKVPYREHDRLMFRMEAFNSTNTPQWSKPGNTLGTSTFGVVTAAGANRVVQVALKYNF